LQHERAGKLAADHFVSRDALDTRAAELESSRADVAVTAAALKTARAQQKKCDLRAPFPAVVMERLGQEGEMASPGAPLLALLDTSRMEVKAEVQEADAAGLKQTARAELQEPGGRWPLRVKRLSAALNKSTRLVEARLTFAGPAAAAGASGQILWRAPELHIPAEFVVRRVDGLGVYLADGDKPRFHPLPDAQEGRPALATGLRGESRVVTKGLGELR
jgi:multidrug efflux pump subunit AcrA (membrane-fusion protein)